MANGITRQHREKIERRDRYVQARIIRIEKARSRTKGRIEARKRQAGEQETDRDSGNAAIATAFPRTAYRPTVDSGARPRLPGGLAMGVRAAESPSAFDAFATRLIDTAMGAYNHQFCGFRIVGAGLWLRAYLCARNYQTTPHAVPATLCL